MRLCTLISKPPYGLSVACMYCGQHVGLTCVDGVLAVAAHAMPPQPPVGAKAEFGTGDACPDGGRVLGRVGVAA